MPVADPAAMPTRPEVLVLDGTSGDLSLLGGKGAALDRLISWGLPVPDAAVVTTAAYHVAASDPTLARLVDRVRAGDAPDRVQVDEAFSAWRPPAELVAEVVKAALAVAGTTGRLAVRSSATVEDLAVSSFAGQYVSVLDVDASDDRAVLDAVRAVFASLWHPAPCAYRRAFGIAEDEVAMAAVMMAMVPARRAGVVFTEDPGGAAGAARIEVVDGLAESLVSGQRTPEAHVVARTGAHGDLPQEAAEALELALEVERRAGCAQDVEWAWDGKRTLLVQARPITVTDGADGDGFDSVVDDHELTTASIGETLPGVLPPLTWQLTSRLVDEAFHRVLDDLATLDADSSPEPLVRRVRGRATLDFSAIRSMAERLPGGVAGDLEQQYFGSRRRDRPSTAATAEPRRWGARLRSVVHDLRVLATRRRVVQDADAVVHAVDQIVASAPELGAVDDRALLAYRARLIDLGVRGMSDELAVAAIAVSAFGRLESPLVPHLGRGGAAAAVERLSSTAGVTVRPPGSASASMFGSATWDELGAEPGVPAGPDDPDAALDVAFEALLTELEARPTWASSSLRRHVRAATLRRVAADVVAQLRRRERTKVAVLTLGGELRRVQVELGRRCCERGALDDPAVVDLLSDVELRAACSGRRPSAVLIAQRRRWLERYEAEGPLPPRFTGAPERRPAELPAGDRLEGWATSPGRAVGVARVVRSATQPVEPGAVLVAEATDASWSPLFVEAAGIVLERGGPLSHAAILARELGVPAVLNVAGATSLLDGLEVLVDGDAGVVVLTGEAPS